MTTFQKGLVAALPDPKHLLGEKSQTVGGGGEDPNKPNNQQPGKGHLVQEPVRCPNCGNRHKGDCDVGFCDKCNRNHRLPCHYCKNCGKRGNHTTGQCRKTGKGGRGGKVQKAPRGRSLCNGLVLMPGVKVFNIDNLTPNAAYALGKSLSTNFGRRQQSGGRGGRGGRVRGRGDNDKNEDQSKKGSDDTPGEKSPRGDMDQS